MNNLDFDKINTKDDLACFIEGFVKSLKTSPCDWENSDLESFLVAMAAWVRVIDNYSHNSGDKGVVDPSWSTFAKILSAAKVYE
ncbi:DUF7660 family protein [Achromobacter aegrifaciens]|uniref:DUF7660 family protein n=1 Tax=Achromobacter aegrifaciens TaxID=1287736 RepID=UPI003F5C5CB6